MVVCCQNVLGEIAWLTDVDLGLVLVRVLGLFVVHSVVAYLLLHQAAHPQQ